MTLEMALDSQVGEVGGRFAGRLSRAPDADGIAETSRARAVTLSLRYRTEGRGNLNLKVVNSVRLDLPANGGLNAHFELAIPHGSPISYDGILIRVLWEIEASIDVKLSRDPKTERPVLVVPVGGVGVYDRPHPLPPAALM